MTSFDPYKSSENWDDDDEILPNTQDSPDQIRDFAKFEAELYAEMNKVPLEEVLPDFLRRAEEMISEMADDSAPVSRGQRASVTPIQEKVFRTSRRSRIPSPKFEPYDAFARDGDGDGIVQEGTIWERPAGTRFVDKLGKEVADQLTLLRPSGNHRIVDSDGQEVSYTPTWQKGKPARLGPTVRTIVSYGEQYAVNKGKTSRPTKVNALVTWFQGDTAMMREHAIHILNNTPIEDVPYFKLMGSAKMKNERAETAALMDFISDGEPFDGSLFRGEELPMSAESLLEELKPGMEFVLPMRSFGETEETAVEYLDGENSEHYEDVTHVLYELLPGSQGADFQKIAKQLEDEGLISGQTIVTGLAPDERFMLAADTEHVIFGTVEVVEVQQVSHPTFGPIFRVVLRQTDTLGKPEDRDTWAESPQRLEA